VYIKIPINALTKSTGLLAEKEMTALTVTIKRSCNVTVVEYTYELKQ